MGVCHRSGHSHLLSSQKTKAEKNLSLQVCKDNYIQISISEGHLKRGYPATTLPGSKECPLCPPTSATAK